MKLYELLVADHAIGEIARLTTLKGLLPIRVAKNILKYQDSVRPFNLVRETLSAEAKAKLEAVSDVEARAKLEKSLSAGVEAKLTELSHDEVEVKFDAILLEDIAPKTGDDTFPLSGMDLAALLRVGFIAERTAASGEV